MNISEFISAYKNHPVLFIGTGISLRYLKNSYTWDGLLSKIAFDLTENQEFYLDIKSQCQEQGYFRFDLIAEKLEKIFNEQLMADRNGKFKAVNDLFYKHMSNGENLSRFKIYISQIFEHLDYREEMLEELALLKKIRKNIGSIITTNYDRLIEDTFEFNVLIGNDILLSNPYGSVYKIHGCCTHSGKMIITSEDYINFLNRYELIRAQLLSLFIHNPIIFMGYGIGDENIKNILKTIFTYIEPNSEQAKLIRANFLLVEYEPGSISQEIVEHDIDMEGFSTIRINKLKTDDFRSIYAALSDLQLTVSALDIRKVQSIVKEIYSGGNIAVRITEDLEEMKNSERILAIGTDKTISYQFLTNSETLSNYFKIVDESNAQALSFIDKYTIPKTQYFPIHAFKYINPKIDITSKLEENQVNKLETTLKGITKQAKNTHKTISEIIENTRIPKSSQSAAIFWGIMKNQLSLAEVEQFLRLWDDKKDSNFRMLLTAYDYVKYPMVEISET